MRYLFLIFIVFLLAGCGADKIDNTESIYDDEIVTDFDGETQTDKDNTQIDQIDNDADEPIDDSEVVDEFDNDIEQVDDEVIISDPDIVVEDDIDEEPDDELPDEIVEDEPDEDGEIIPDTCGDGGYNFGEECDIGTFTEMPCQQFFADKYNSPNQTAVTAGNIYCRSNCTIDYSQCQINPNFKIIRGNHNGSYLIYTGTDNKGLRLKKSRSYDPGLEMRSYKCMPIFDEYNLKLYPMTNTIMRRFLNVNNELGKKINDSCILKGVTVYPDKVDLTYYDGERDGFDFRDDCTDLDELNNNPNNSILIYPFDVNTIFVLNHHIKYRLEYPNDQYQDGYLTARPNYGIYMVRYPTILGATAPSDQYRVLCFDTVSQPTSY